MKAKLMSLHSPDVLDLKRYSPVESDNFGFLLQMFIGIDGSEGEESFDVLVCTPKWLLSEYNVNDLVWGYHHMIVFQYDYELIVNKIERYIHRVQGNTWDEIARKISLIGRWEFDSYNDSTPASSL